MVLSLISKTRHCSLLAASLSRPGSWLCSLQVRHSAGTALMPGNCPCPQVEFAGSSAPFSMHVEVRHLGRKLRQERWGSLPPDLHLGLERQREDGPWLGSTIVAATWRSPELSLSWEGPRCGALCCWPQGWLCLPAGWGWEAAACPWRV